MSKSAEVPQRRDADIESSREIGQLPGSMNSARNRAGYGRHRGGAPRHLARVSVATLAQIQFSRLVELDIGWRAPRVCSSTSRQVNDDEVVGLRREVGLRK